MIEINYLSYFHIVKTTEEIMNCHGIATQATRHFEGMLAWNPLGQTCVADFLPIGESYNPKLYFSIESAHPMDVASDQDQQGHPLDWKP